MMHEINNAHFIKSTRRTVQICGQSYSVIAETETGIPLVDIPMMSAERERATVRRCRKAHPELYDMYDRMLSGYTTDAERLAKQREWAEMIEKM